MAVRRKKGLNRGRQRPNSEEMKADGTAYFALDSNALPWEQRTNPHLPAPICRKG